MKKWLWLVLLLFLIAPRSVWSQSNWGYFVDVECDRINNKLANAVICIQYQDSAARKAGEYRWTGTEWIKADGAFVSATTPPPLCRVGDLWVNSAATPGSNLNICTAVNTWTNVAGGGGGSPSFSAITSGTNTAASMVVGTGGSLSASGSGTISATTAAALANSLTNHAVVIGQGSGTPGTIGVGNTGDCLQGVSGANPAFSPCPTSSGGAGFGTITSGTNTTAAMVVGTGGSLSITGSGTITATTATALAVNPSPCAANTFVTDLDANGTLTCAQPTFTNLSGAATKAQLPTTTVFTDQANTYTAGAQNMKAAASFSFPQSAFAAPTAQNDCRFDTTSNRIKCGDGASTKTYFAIADPASSVNVTPAGSITATDVAGALNQLDTGKQPVNANLTTLAGITASNIVNNSQSYCADAGSTDAYSCTNPAVTLTSGPVTGAIYQLRANTVNTLAGGASINFGAGGVKSIKKYSSGAKVDPADGDIPAGYTLVLIYDGTDMVCTNCPPTSVGGTGTMTGPLSTTNCVAKEGTGPTNVTCSQIVDDGAGTISYYDVSGNRHENSYITATGTRTHTFPDLSGTIAQTTGSLVNGRVAEFNASGLIVSGNNTTTMLRTRQAGFMLGADTGPVLADTDDQTTIFVNRLGQGVTITEVWCESDAGTPTIQLQKDDGSPVNMINATSLSCSSSGASTTSFVSGENNIANGNRVDFVMVAAGGVAKRVTVNFVYTLD
jgi:hypothetical protein